MGIPHPDLYVPVRFHAAQWPLHIQRWDYEAWANTYWTGASYAPNYNVFGGTGFISGWGFGLSDTLSPYTMSSIPTGTSNTIGLVEHSGSFPSYPQWSNWWAGECWGPGFSLCSSWGYYGTTYLPQVNATPATANPYQPQGYHPGVLVVAMMDGSVRTIHGNISQNTWTAVVQPTSGLAPGSDW